MLNRIFCRGTKLGLISSINGVRITAAKPNNIRQMSVVSGPPQLRLGKATLYGHGIVQGIAYMLIPWFIYLTLEDNKPPKDDAPA